MAGNDRKLGGGQEGLSPAAFRENAALPATQFQTSSCQNRDRTNFYAFKPSSLLYFIVQPKETIAMYPCFLDLILESCKYLTYYKTKMF